MISQAFEIKVALLGHVSVGKTTVLNALFQDKFSEVSMRRTTAGINHFQVSFCNKKKQKNNEENTHNHTCILCNIPSEKNTKQDEDDFSASSGVTENGQKKTAKQTLDEITIDNSILRTKNTIQEKYFNINIDEPFVQMRDDTHLVLVDVPGVNEAGSSKLYLDYVKDSWDQFDCVIVVMDAIQGVNTEEQVNLLSFVKQNQDEKKQVPLIILVNKVDDPDDKEVKVLVDEVRDKVEQIFEAPNLDQWLSNTLKRNDISPKDLSVATPAFIPISAENGFLYRAASRLQLSEFSMLDMDYIDKIGREELGRFKWKKLSREQKYEAVYEVVSDPKEYKERLAASNFDKFLSTLDFFVGGNKTQEGLIEKQLEVALVKLSSENNIAESLSGIYDKCKVLKKPTEVLKDKFWMLFADCHKYALESFADNPKKITALHKPMEELMNYSQDLHKRLHSRNSSDVAEEKKQDARKIVEAMKDIVKGQCNILLEKEAAWKRPQIETGGRWTWQGNCWCNHNTGRSNNDKSVHPEGDKPQHWRWDIYSQKWKHTHTGYTKNGTADQNPAKLPSWDKMSPRDWSTAISSILLMSHNKHFCENFGQQIADLEWLVHTPGEFNSVKRAQNESNSFAGPNIKVPDSPSDPNHWGHLVWVFCEFAEYNI